MLPQIIGDMSTFITTLKIAHAPLGNFMRRGQSCGAGGISAQHSKVCFGTIKCVFQIGTPTGGQNVEGLVQGSLGSAEASGRAFKASKPF